MYRSVSCLRYILCSHCVIQCIAKREAGTLKTRTQEEDNPFRDQDAAEKSCTANCSRLGVRQPGRGQRVVETPSERSMRETYPSLKARAEIEDTEVGWVDETAEKPEAHVGRTFDPRARPWRCDSPVNGYTARSSAQSTSLNGKSPSSSIICATNTQNG